MYNTEQHLYAVTEVITFLDGYRVAYCQDPDIIDRKISNMEIFTTNFKKNWKRIKSDLYKVASFPLQLSKIRTLIKFQGMLRMIQTFILILTFSLAMASIFTRGPIFGTFFPIILIALSISFAVVFLLEKFASRKISFEIDNYYKANSSKFEEIFERLRVIVQELINDLNQKIVKYEKKPEKFKFALYNIDYTGISIVKKPNLTRNYFIVIPGGKK